MLYTELTKILRIPIKFQKSEDFNVKVTRVPKIDKVSGESVKRSLRDYLKFEKSFTRILRNATPKILNYIN